MLEQLRRNSRSFLIWVIFAFIIAAFILFFGPQAGPDMFSCGGGGERAGAVEGRAIKASSWRFAMIGLGYGSRAGYLERHTAIDYLVERELLAQAAEESGFRISDDEVNEHVKNGDFIIMGRMQPAPWFREDGRFDYELLERVVYNFGLGTVDNFLEEQRREYLAEAQRQLLLSAVTASEEEARTTYIREQTKVSLDYLKFEAEKYEKALRPTEAHLTAFADANPEKIKAEYDREKSRWPGSGEWVLLRHVRTSSAGDKEGGADAKTRAETALRRLKAGTAFATVAAEASDEESTKHRAGYLGWKSAASIGYGTGVVEAVARLKDGEMSEVVESDGAYHIVKLEKRHTGELTEELLKLDLALRVAPKEWGAAAAKLAAERALAELGDRPLNEVFPVEEPEPPMGGNQQLSPEVLEALRKAQQEGRIKLDGPVTLPPTVPSPGPANPEPANPEPANPEPENSAPDTPAPANPEPANPAPDTPAPTGNEQGAVYYESGNFLAQSEPTDTPVAAAPIDTEAFAALDIPTADLEQVKVQSTGPTSRNEFIPGVGLAPELSDALFETLQVGQVAKQVFDVPSTKSYIVAQLTQRQDPDMEEFEERKQAYLRGLALQKGADLLYHWIHQRCRQVTEAGAIEVSPEFLADAGDEEQPTYETCKFIAPSTISDQIQSRVRMMLGLGFGL